MIHTGRAPEGPPGGLSEARISLAVELRFGGAGRASSATSTRARNRPSDPAATQTTAADDVPADDEWLARAKQHARADAIV